MVRASLPVRIESVRPSAVYRGTVYTQDAVVSLDSGPAFEIYDYRTALSEAHIGTTQSVGLLVLLANVQQAAVDENGVTFDREKQPVFRGRVTDVDRTGDRPVGVLDVGVGTVLFYPDEAGWTVARGDSIRLSRTVRHLVLLH